MAYIPQPGDYGVVKTKGWAAKLIQIGTRSRWNHAFIYIGDDKIIEANPTGVEISPVSKYEKISWNQHEGLVPEMRGHIVAAAYHFVGQPYGFFDIGNLILRIIGLKFLANTKLLERLAVRNGVICSELVSLCYRGIGLPLTDTPDHLVTPGDLAERLVYQ
jgi:cell wall-associated NlpC family hydrolase